ncbi:hypothetical protein [Entomomonas asaccharolytica]|uniref:Uncharacterized protein n=1 Tax=Entomomonas asaccharolytica TaxID=2785331 RepID=A0A974NE39_9GAMM|nr:hypothetical protein [Entomomonas asaccharolytica]QQP84804.1 hypothetical protein JHT90_10370 [Entomomonas asaccharolytica]
MDDDFNSINWFANYSSESFLNSINYLVSNEHWNKNTIFFGSYDNDSIAISYNSKDKTIVEIYFRINLRGDYELMAKSMINSILSGSLIILNVKLEVIGKTYEALISEVEFTVNQKRLIKSF